ncbi:hypothetical protein PIB30_016138 [Stylosanthes scabra]|uniref:Uncharacterized protein n=1 Tax=Stylosanthes scabra TaxID=79078 RepID=A0ABU6S726_9FABA|nr:hypothetical protein [Stylosanthes scabra]
MAKNSLERYTHYYERCASSQSSRQRALAVTDLHKMQTVHPLLQPRSTPAAVVSVRAASLYTTHFPALIVPPPRLPSTAPMDTQSAPFTTFPSHFFDFWFPLCCYKGRLPPTASSHLDASVAATSTTAPYRWAPHISGASLFSLPQ